MKPYNVVLAIVGEVLQAMLARILVTRKLWKFFRFFFIYTCYSVISTTATPRRDAMSRIVSISQATPA